ncbi:hypothetical protein Psfp_00444 [Pelotomaculum sp. FP]|uniref:pilus assembly FimT family protein n=1 Tax=Pelotomaculum sp. FP TaxID=261474 RepID=UPI0011036478|nr:prepilin-type N-terminal cleavage/methylation domain-containing protein [Pelotomaculum sp. FP]TEB17572.1 hypothetical protein Psfp_00444 [Pelotomaculum sp. FP]
MPPIEKQTPMVQNNLGFTIIEMVLVMLIISIAVAFTVPNFKKILDAYQLDISAREMASDIRDLQQSAIKTQSTALSIMWNLSSGTYYLKNENTVIKSVTIPNSVEIIGAPFIPVEKLYKMRISVKGRPLGGYNGTVEGFGGTITLKDKTTKKYKDVVIDTLGRVRVSETYQ